ncbi:hypothetical protein [Terrabacter sp. NPDC000476]|uniref:hypothetical protein n=1 Tax=Terrabacter sp. NPDC000476 TaxID=3154258 RepID=UPI00332B2B01
MPARPATLRTVTHAAAVLLVAGGLVVGGLHAARVARDVAPSRTVLADALVVETAGAGSLRPVGDAVVPLTPGREQWVSIPWTTDAAVCSVAVTVTTPDAAVHYPSGTKAFTSFYREDRLAAAGRDYTAVRLTVPSGSERTAVTAEVTARFTLAARAARSGACTGESSTRTYRVTLPVGPSGAAAA